MPKTKYLVKNTLVIVEWEDAWAEATWLGNEEESSKHNECLATNVGWVLVHDARGILLYTARTNDGTIGGRNFIPKGMIRSIKNVNNP